MNDDLIEGVEMFPKFPSPPSSLSPAPARPPHKKPSANGAANGGEGAIRGPCWGGGGAGGARPGLKRSGAP